MSEEPKQKYKEVARRKRLTKARYRFAWAEGQTVHIPSTEDTIQLLRDNKQPRA